MGGGDIYDKVQQHGLGVTGSRSAQGGVGGLALAGGLSLFPSREGFICDNVLNFEVVLASGETISATASENAEPLARPLRGGGNNLGGRDALRPARPSPRGPFRGGAVFLLPAQLPGPGGGAGA